MTTTNEPNLDRATRRAPLRLCEDVVVDATDGPCGDLVDVVIDRTSRRATHVVGHVDGFVIAPDDGVTDVIVRRGHLWSRHEVLVPAAFVASFSGDRVVLALARDAVADLASPER